MRIRSIRPEFWASEDIAALPWAHRLIYIGLWSYVDDNGVGRDVPRLIVADLFPLDDDTQGALMQVAGALKSFETRQMISRYKVSGKPYLHVTAWETHQKINRPSGARYPLPTCGNAETHDTLSEPSVSPHAKNPLGEGEKGRRGEGEKAARATRATALPVDWSPTVEHKEQAVGSGLDLDRELVKFRAYSDEKGRTAKNWNAAFTRWLMNAAEYASRDGRVLPLPGAAPRAVVTDQWRGR